MIRPVEHIGAMSAYALAELSTPAAKRLVSLSQNESLRPPSPKALRAAAEAMASAHLYPDPEWSALKEALYDLHARPAGEVLCGNGSMELISSLTLAFCDETGAVLAPQHAYPYFKTAAQLVRARYDTARETDAGVCVDALLAAVQPETRVVFVANPGNPTGTRVPNADLRRLRDGLRADILLVIDEAYGEFADHVDAPLFDLVARGDTVVLRTFSKAYGLAGLRVGWGLFPPAIAREVRKVMAPNAVTVAGQAAALSALTDQAYMRETCALIAGLRDRFITKIRGIGCDVGESYTNFALIRFGSPEAAEAAHAALNAEGVFLRPQGGAGLPHCLRATVGPEADMMLAAEVLAHWARENG
jgi:histidinol-phosphate aminotransferase